MATDVSARLRAIATHYRCGRACVCWRSDAGLAPPREIARRIGRGHVPAIDRSKKAIAQARLASRKEIASGRLRLRQVAIEDFELEPGEPRFDLAFAIRVGALDGRHPEAKAQARRRIAAVLKPGGRVFTDGGGPLREIPRWRS